jgi:hypothetical protein
MTKAGRRQPLRRDQFVILIDERVPMQFTTGSPRTPCMRELPGVRVPLPVLTRCSAYLRRRDQISARGEQSSGTPVHGKLVYVVIPLRRFMLRDVRDKLFPGRIRPTPPRPGSRGAPRSPPGEGHPLTMFGGRWPPSRCLYLLGDDPQTPGVGFAHKAWRGFRALGTSCVRFG